MIVTAIIGVFICRCLKELGHRIYLPHIESFHAATCFKSLSESSQLIAKIGEFLSYLMAAI